MLLTVESSLEKMRQMMTQLPRNTRRVIELGGGTGVFTQALIDHGIDPAAKRLILRGGVSGTGSWCHSGPSSRGRTP